MSSVATVDLPVEGDPTLQARFEKLYSCALSIWSPQRQGERASIPGRGSGEPSQGVSGTGSTR